MKGLRRAGARVLRARYEHDCEEPGRARLAKLANGDRRAKPRAIGPNPALDVQSGMGGPWWEFAFLLTNGKSLPCHS